MGHSAFVIALAGAQTGWIQGSSTYAALLPLLQQLDSAGINIQYVPQLLPA